MKTNAPLQIRRGASTATEARIAVAEIRQFLHQDHTNQTFTGVAIGNDYAPA